MWPYPLGTSYLGGGGFPRPSRTALREAARPHKRADTVGRDSLDHDLQRRCKLPAWSSDPASPCTTADVLLRHYVERCVTLWCGLHVPHCARPGPTGWGYRQRCSCPRREFGELKTTRGNLSGRRPKRAEVPPGRVSLGKGGEVCPVRSCQGQGPTT